MLPDRQLPCVACGALGWCMAGVDADEVRCEKCYGQPIEKEADMSDVTTVDDVAALAQIIITLQKEIRRLEDEVEVQVAMAKSRDETMERAYEATRSWPAVFPSPRIRERIQQMCKEHIELLAQHRSRSPE